jgi:hypothetical protein
MILMSHILVLSQPGFLDRQLGSVLSGWSFASRGTR